MSDQKKLTNPFSDLSYCLLALLSILVPLVFTTSIENGFVLTKSVTLKVIGGIFIITSIIILMKRLSAQDPGLRLFMFERKTDLAVLLFLLSAALSTIFSIRPSISFFGQLERQIGFVLYIYLILIFFFTSQILNSEQRVRMLFLVMEITGIIVSVYGFMQYFKMDPFEMSLIQTRPVSTLGHGIFMAGFLIMVYPVSLLAALESPKPFLRYLSPLIITLGIISSQTRAVYIAWIAVTCLMLLLYKHVKDNTGLKRLLIYFVFIIVLISLGVILASLVFPDSIYVKRFYSISKFFDSSRILLWRDSMKVFMKYPVIGSGIETFSYVFESAASQELRRMEVNRFFDNAHSNFVQTICTMGIVGIVSYIGLLVTAIILSAKRVLSKSLSPASRIIALPLLGSFIAYFMYGISDFDNNVMLLYLFIYIAILRSLYVQESVKDKLKLPVVSRAYKFTAYVFVVVIVCFAVFNIYISYNDILADRYFQTGKRYYAAGNFNASVEMLNRSVVLNYGCPEYKFTLANYVYDFAVNNTVLIPETKLKLLTQAEEELGRAEVNYPSVMQCEALRAMIFLEQGKDTEASKLIPGILERDPYMIPLRNNLAAYYLKKQDYPKLKEQLELLNKYDPLNIKTANTSLIYYLKVNDTAGAIKCCEIILKLEPGNEKVKMKLEELRSIK